MRHRILSLFLIVFIVFAMTLTAFAQGFDAGETGSVSVTLTEQSEKLPIVGAELSIYQVAEVEVGDTLRFRYTKEFESCGIALEDPSLTAKLEGIIGTYIPSHTGRTDASGAVKFTDLPLGLYFVRQTGTVKGFAPCTPFLVTLPVKTSAGYEYQVNASPKTDVVRLTSITIQKVWNTDETVRVHASVTVNLLRNNAVIETAVLNEKNNWRVTYHDLPQSDGYEIEEVNVPEGFTATYAQHGTVFTVTNTASLPQTGQLLWPVLVLAVAGLLLLALGGVLLRNKRDADA